MGNKSKICPSCGEKNNPSFSICWKCGASFGDLGANPIKVHHDDKKLVLPADIDWFSNVTAQDVSKFESDDNIPKMAAYLKYREDDGLSREEATSKVRKYFPYYYFNVETREKDPYQGEDALLPYCLKYRINRAAADLDKSEAESSTTMNALIRKLIRSGRM